MDEKTHIDNINRYYKRSEFDYDFLLGGAKHFGFHPNAKKIPEREALVLMQDKIADNLNLKSTDKVLDAGCGQGVVAVYLAKKYSCSVEGIDVVPFEIRKARKLAQNSGVAERVNFKVMSYDDIDSEEERFDCIYTSETLSHSLDVKSTLKGFYSVLKKGGRIALFEYTISEDKEFSQNELKILRRVNKGSCMHGLKDIRHDKFQDVISEAGFRRVRCQDITQSTEPSLARLRKYLIVPYYLFVKPFGLQERFPNASAAVEYYRMAIKGLIRYNIFTAVK